MVNDLRWGLLTIRLSCRQWNNKIEVCLFNFYTLRSSPIQGGTVSATMLHKVVAKIIVLFHLVYKRTFCSPKNKSTLMALQTTTRAIRRNTDFFPKLQITDIVQPGSSKVGIFLNEDRPWSVSSLVKVSGVSAASAFAWLRTPRHRRSWGLPALQWWWNIFEMSQNWGNFLKFCGRVTVCLMLQVSCLEYFVLETFKRIWIDIPNLHDTPKSYPLKACNWGEKNLWALQ